MIKSAVEFEKGQTIPLGDGSFVRSLRCWIKNATGGV